MNNAKRKLGASDIVEIRRRLGEGDTVRAIAADFKINFVTVSDIKRGATWEWLK